MDCSKRKKQTKSVLINIYYSPQSKSSTYMFGGWSRNKNFTQIQLLKILYVLVDASQNQKKTLFILAFHAPRN